MIRGRRSSASRRAAPFRRRAISSRDWPIPRSAGPYRPGPRSDSARPPCRGLRRIARKKSKPSSRTVSDEGETRTKGIVHEASQALCLQLPNEGFKEQSALPLRVDLRSISGAVLLSGCSLRGRFYGIEHKLSGPGSLAQAADDANSVPGPNQIVFAIPGSGVHTIDLSNSGIVLSYSITIDGYTQPGASPNTLSVGDNAVILIQLDGGGPFEPGFRAASILMVTIAWFAVSRSPGSQGRLPTTLRFLSVQRRHPRGRQSSESD